jgi:uncharacterized membrane protein YobD (UPF0266 family)
MSLVDLATVSESVSRLLTLVVIIFRYRNYKVIIQKSGFHHSQIWIHNE